MLTQNAIPYHSDAGHTRVRDNSTTAISCLNQKPCCKIQVLVDFLQHLAMIPWRGLIIDYSLGEGENNLRLN